MPTISRVRWHRIRLQDILDVLGQRQSELETALTERREATQAIEQRVSQLADQIRQWNNGVLPSGTCACLVCFVGHS